MRKFNIPKVGKSYIEKMIGIPLNDMFAKFTELDPSKLSYAFREYYGAKGIHQSKLLPGIENKLKELKEYGFQLGVITSKRQELAIKIAEYLKIDGFFDYIFGESNEIKSKLDSNLKSILYERFPSSNFVVIGDHPKDALFSKNLSCPFIGVLTGTHKEESLRKARANNKLTLILKSVKQMSVDMILALVKKNR